MSNRDTIVSKAVAAIAKELQQVYDGALDANIVHCIDCTYWEPENAEEGDTSGHCRNNYCPCQNQQTDAFWYCADGEQKEE